MIEEDGYRIDEAHRCMFCQAREVITMRNGKEVNTNLHYIDGKLVCRDRKLCWRNQLADRTTIIKRLSIIDKPSHIIKVDGEVILEVVTDEIQKERHSDV